MAKYLEFARELRNSVDVFLGMWVDESDRNVAAVALGHIINSAVLCNPRKPQHTVRKNIVETAMEGQAVFVSMKEETSENGYTYHKLSVAQTKP